MNKELRKSLISALIFFVLIASAIFTVPARADNGSPPPPAPSGPTKTSVSQVAATTPNTFGGDVHNHKVVLTSQDAAQIAQPGDPIWCPATVAVPVAGAAGCSPSGVNTNLYTLTHAVQTGISFTPVLTNSNIWILEGPGIDSSPSLITLDGSPLALPAGISTLGNFSLNFKGGWKGAGFGTVDSNHPSIVHQGIQIQNWNNSVTMSNIQFNNVPGNPGRGFDITTNGNISLINVQANTDNGAGAVLNNSGGTGTVSITNGQFNNDTIAFDAFSLFITSKNAVTLTSVVVNGGFGASIDNTGGTNKPVTIKESNFDNNNSDGLTVNSKGAITLTDVSSSNNLNVSYGAILDNHTGTAAPVTLTGTNIFDNNTSYGLWVKSAGKITSGSLDANYNTKNFGAKIDNSFASSAQPLTLLGTSSFSGNGADGLQLLSSGAITANNLFADDNLGVGVTLRNNNAFIEPVKVTGTNWFAGNAYEGITIFTNGAVALNNINATTNGYLVAADGLYIDNQYGSTPEGVILTGSNTFNQNTNAGAEILASGAVSLSNVTAFDNTAAAGLVIQNVFLGPEAVSLLGTNSLTGNHADNLDVNTFGAITVDNLTASGSVTGTGANLYYGANVSGNVAINGTNTFSNNQLNGLTLGSKGSVVLSNISASNNTTGYGADVVNTTSTTFSPVTLMGTNTFNGNSTDGLDIVSNGRISINNLTANGSITGSGASLINTGAGSTHPQAVILGGTNTFNTNHSDGLDIFSFGLVTASNLNANGNGHASGNHGVFIDNFTAGAPQNVIFTGNNVFDSNYGFGLSIISLGGISIANLDASSNTHNDGADLINVTGVAGVTLTGTHTFNHNFGDGLYIDSGGFISASNLSAAYNGSSIGTFGVKLDNTSSTAAAPVTLTGTNVFFNNYSDGLRVTSHGSITTTNLDAEYNNATYGSNGSDAGVWLDNCIHSLSVCTSGFIRPVTLNGINKFLDNDLEGLDVSSSGAITTNNLTANSNGNYGAMIRNDYGGTAAITAKGTNVFLYNNDNGLYLYSDGPVSITHVTANYNYFNGIFADTTGTFTITCGTFVGNGQTGALYGNGWATGLNTLNISIIGVDSVGNYSAPSFVEAGGATVTYTPRTCPLP
jgi:hypothetical protein